LNDGLRFKDAKIGEITFQLARLKAWKFRAKTEAMSAEQRRLYEETLAEEEASLLGQLEQAKGEASTPPEDRCLRTVGASRFHVPAQRILFGLRRFELAIKFQRIVAFVQRDTKSVSFDASFVGFG
jgi:hypothetical protein